MSFCLCGCAGEIVEKPHHKYYGKPRHLKHHAPNRTGVFKESTNRNTMYARSKRVNTKRLCSFKKLDQRKGRFEIHHIDGNIQNNDLENLLNVCTSHHKLIHNGKFNIDKPEKLIYRVDGSGKRRYQ